MIFSNGEVLLGADARERLVDESIRDAGIAQQSHGEPAVPGAEPPPPPVQQDARGNSRFHPAWIASHKRQKGERNLGSLRTRVNASGAKRDFSDLRSRVSWT